MIRFKSLKTGHFAINPATTMALVAGTEYMLPPSHEEALKRQGFLGEPIVEKAAGKETAPKAKSSKKKTGARKPAEETKDEDPAEETK